jgi:uncharacterized protein YqjF (DUF2071 family)
MTDRRPPFLTARWHTLVMLNYEMAPDLLAPLVPEGTELDTFEGRCLASVVGFRFVDTRLLGVPIPFHRDFDELNLRFYVRRSEGDEVRRGVVFVREVVPRRAIAWVARWSHGERYVARPMGHLLQVDPERGGSAGFRWQARRGGPWCELRATFRGAPVLPEAGSEEEFITEHYWGYAQQRQGSVEYRVEHPQWRVWPARESSLSGDLSPLYGPDLAAALTGPPCSAFVAEGSPVSVHWGRRISAAGP